MIDNQSKWLKFARDENFYTIENFLDEIGNDPIQCCNDAETCDMHNRLFNMNEILDKRMEGIRDKRSIYINQKLLWRVDGFRFRAYTIHNNLTYDIWRCGDDYKLYIWIYTCQNKRDNRIEYIRTSIEQIKFIAQSHFERSFKRYCVRKGINLIDLNLSSFKNNIHYLSAL